MPTLGDMREGKSTDSIGHVGGIERQRGGRGSWGGGALAAPALGGGAGRAPPACSACGSKTRLPRWLSVFCVLLFGRTRASPGAALPNGATETTPSAILTKPSVALVSLGNCIAFRLRSRGEAAAPSLGRKRAAPPASLEAGEADRPVEPAECEGVVGAVAGAVSATSVPPSLSVSLVCVRVTSMGADAVASAASMDDAADLGPRLESADGSP